tara:strand:- start:251 stop:409 length:159 start_codon:yes stop_codon:yes gene_type:complete
MLFFLIKKFLSLYQIFFIFQTIAAKKPIIAAIIALPDEGSTYANEGLVIKKK